MSQISTHENSVRTRLLILLVLYYLKYMFISNLFSFLYYSYFKIIITYSIAIFFLQWMFT